MAVWLSAAGRRSLVERQRYELASQQRAEPPLQGFQRYGFHWEDTIKISLFIIKKNRSVEGSWVFVESLLLEKVGSWSNI
jgi:hypothetical protein